MKILVVDDNGSSRKLLRLTLAAEGHDVMEAADGQEALETLESSEVDAVICDILMPRLDGYRFCYEARRRPALQSLPIIIYSSTYTSASDEATALNSGADRFLRKPSPAAVILRTLSDVTTMPREASPSRPHADELEVLKEYSERLVQKLEEKNLELEAAKEKLSAAYDKLERSERRSRELVELAPIGICQTAPDGLLIAANTTFARMLGYSSPQELMGLEMARDLCMDPTDRRKVVQEVDRSGGVSALEIRFKRRDGPLIWVQTDSRTVKDPTGKVLRYEIFVLDVTERKQVEEALRQSEARKRAVLEASLDSVITIDEDGAVIEVNPAAERTFGRSASEMLGRDLAEMIIPPALREAHRKGLERHRQTGERRILGRTVEMPALRRDGEEFPVELFISRVEVEGAPHFIGFIRDLTERKKAEKDTRRSEERFRRLFESNAIGIAVVDLAGGLVEANDAYLEMLGYTREDFRSGIVRWDDSTPPEFRASDEAAFEALRHTGVSPSWQKEMLRKDGSRVPVLLGLKA